MFSSHSSRLPLILPAVFLYLKYLLILAALLSFLFLATVLLLLGTILLLIATLLLF